MLTLGWSDGNSFVPMMLSMFSSAKEDNRLAPMRDGIDKRTNGYQRRQESMKKSTDVLVEMVAMAMTAGTTARRHLLFDSWFAFPATIRRIHPGNAHHLHAQGHRQGHLRLERLASHPEGTVQRGPQAPRPGKSVGRGAFMQSVMN